MRSLSFLVLLVCLASAAALHVQPVQPAGAMRLRGGKGLVGIDNLSKLSMGLTLAQGSVMFFAPDQTLKLYGAAPATSKEDDTWETSLTEMTGANLLSSVITMIAVHAGQPLHKAVAYGLVGIVAYAVKWNRTEAPKFKQPTAPIYGWAAVAAVTALLMYRGGGGLVETKTLVKGWALVMAATAVPFFVAPELIFKTYKVKEAGPRPQLLVRGMMIFQLATAAFILGCLCPRSQPAPAWGGWWTVLALALVKGILDADYKTFQMANGYPQVALCVLAAGLAFEGNAT